MASSNYPDSIEEGLKSLKAAKATIKLLYEENQTLKESLELTQDELENWRSKFHQRDKEKSILDARIASTTFAEILKFVFSSLSTAYGINLISDGNNDGYFWILGSVVLYIAITYLASDKKT